MNINWTKSMSTSIPSEVSVAPSGNSVYLRKNVEEFTYEDGLGIQRVGYRYDEALLTKEEYDRYQDKLETEAMIAEVIETIFAE